MAKIPLQKVFLDRFHYIPLIPVITPVSPLSNVTQHVQEAGAKVEVFVKRDDLTGLAGGGNKLRKLEFLLCDAIETGCDTVITAGGIQSNHCRQTAGAAARLGLQTHLVLNRNVADRDPLYHQSGNLVLNTLFGAEMHIHPAKINRLEKMEELAAELRRAGRTPYIIPVGGSNALGALGYVKCALELFEEQYDIFRPANPEHAVTVLCATSSYGTLAGLAVGISMLRKEGRLHHAVRTVGVDVDGDDAGDVRARVLRIVDETFDLLAVPQAERTAAAHLDILDGHGGPGYGQPNPAMAAAVRLAAAREGLLLDPVYTGKAFAALLAAAAAGRLPPGAVVFVHTGGAPALHAYPDEFPAGPGLPPA